jgi:glycosyltransferase involved in cell wall biosynthesis
MACGTPVTAFNVGGIKDMIDHQVNGYLAAPFDVDDYVNGIKFILDQEDSTHLHHQCRHKVLTTFSEAVVAQRHFELYHELHKNSRNG